MKSNTTTKKKKAVKKSKINEIVFPYSSVHPMVWKYGLGGFLKDAALGTANAITGGVFNEKIAPKYSGDNPFFQRAGEFGAGLNPTMALGRKFSGTNAEDLGLEDSEYFSSGQQVNNQLTQAALAAAGSALLPGIGGQIGSQVGGLLSEDINTQQQNTFAEGGFFNGPAHTEGGIQLGSKEVEGNEYRHEFTNGQYKGQKYIFRKELKKEVNKIIRKYKNRKTDKLAIESMDKEFENLVAKNESMRTTPNTGNKMKGGGPDGVPYNKDFYSISTSDLIRGYPKELNVPNELISYPIKYIPNNLPVLPNTLSGKRDVGLLNDNKTFREQYIFGNQGLNLKQDLTMPNNLTGIGDNLYTNRTFDGRYTLDNSEDNKPKNNNSDIYKSILNGLGKYGPTIGSGIASIAMNRKGLKAEADIEKLNRIAVPEVDYSNSIERVKDMQTRSKKSLYRSSRGLARNKSMLLNALRAGTTDIDRVAGQQIGNIMEQENNMNSKLQYEADKFNSNTDYMEKDINARNKAAAEYQRDTARANILQSLQGMGKDLILSNLLGTDKFDINSIGSILFK